VPGLNPPESAGQHRTNERPVTIVDALGKHPAAKTVRLKPVTTCPVREQHQLLLLGSVLHEANYELRILNYE